MNKKTAFTIAEILITLSIIGVVAALTIPALVRDFQRTQYETGIKKAYTEFNKVILKISAERDCANNLRCTGLFDAGTTNKTLGDELIKYFLIYKNCETAAGQECWTTKTNQNYDGSSASDDNWDDSSAYKFMTTDGASYLVSNYTDSGSGFQPDCSNNLSTGSLGYMSEVCGYIYVDINGLKKPNRFGKDTFGFYITNGKGAFLYPFGGFDDNSNGNMWWNNGNANKCSSSNNDKTGYYCTGRVMENAWQMDY